MSNPPEAAVSILCKEGHAWAAQVRGGMPIAIPICYLCGVIDWDDIRNQVEKIREQAYENVLNGRAIMVLAGLQQEGWQPPPGWHPTERSEPRKRIEANCAACGKLVIAEIRHVGVTDAEECSTPTLPAVPTDLATAMATLERTQPAIDALVDHSVAEPRRDR